MKFRKLFCSLLLALTLAATGVITVAMPIAAASVDDVDPYFVTIGSQVYVSGTGLTGSGAAAIRFGSATNTTNQITIPANRINAAGVWDHTFTVPTGLTGGNQNIYAVRTNSPAGAVPAQIYILPKITSISPESAAVGSTITIEGNGFIQSTSFYVYFGSNRIRVTPASGSSANANGTLANFRVTVPSGLTSGNHDVIIENRTSGDDTDPVSLNIKPSLTVTPTTGKIGDTLDLALAGFGGGSVTIYFNNQSLKTITVPSTGNNAGSATTTIDVPSVSSGTHTITARGTSAGGEASAEFTISQQITVSPATVAVGETVTVTGNGFSSNQPVVITVGGTTVNITPAVITSSTGTFNATFPMPVSPKGERTIQAQVGSSSSSATITVREKLTASPTSSSRGGSITLSGTGFTPGTASVALSDISLGTVTVESNGSFSATITIPANAPFGKHSLTVQGISRDFTVDPEVTLSPASGAQGDTVTITGNGFRPQRTISFSIDNLYDPGISGTVTTNASGSFSATFVIPGLPKGQYNIIATDGNEGDSERKTGSGQLTVNTKINQLEPSTGQAGDQVTILGTGFAANRPITLTFGGQSVNTGSTITTNDYGWFTVIFTVPNIPAGNIAVTASDGTNSATATYALQVNVSVNHAVSSADPGWVGMDLGVTGGGFKASSPITITFDNSTTAAATGSTNAQGAFSITFNVPALTAGAHKMKISDGTTIVEVDFVMESAAPPAPLLLSPLTASKPKQPVTFNWSEVTDPSGITYEFQLSKDSTFSTINLLLDETGLTFTTIGLPADYKLESASGKTPYVWRVRAVDGAGNVGEWSTVNTFNIGMTWPSWLIHVWYSLGIIAALIFGLWFGRRMAYQSY